MRVQALVQGASPSNYSLEGGLSVSLRPAWPLGMQSVSGPRWPKGSSPVVL